MLAVVRVERMSKISLNIKVSENVHVKCAFVSKRTHFDASWSSYTSKSY